jgi:predicted DNA-binding transcriptional regulator AlpA
MTIKKAGEPAAGIAPNHGISGGELIRGWAGICAEVHKSRVQLWRDIRAGRFPAPIETGSNSIAWFKLEVDDWLATRPRRTYGALPAE